MGEKFDKYITENNLEKIILFNKLHTRSELKNLTIEQLKHLVHVCCSTISNLHCALEKGKLMLELDDKNNLWQSSSLINRIIELNFIEFEPTFECEKELKKQLTTRWKKNS